MEQYEDMAYRIAAQVLDADHRGASVPYTPAAGNVPDDTCAEQFVRTVGRRLFRHALTDEEIATRVALTAQSATALEDFCGGHTTYQARVSRLIPWWPSAK